MLVILMWMCVTHTHIYKYHKKKIVYTIRKSLLAAPANILILIIGTSILNHDVTHFLYALRRRLLQSFIISCERNGTTETYDTESVPECNEEKETEYNL